MLSRFREEQFGVVRRVKPSPDGVVCFGFDDVLAFYIDSRADSALD